MIKTRYVQHQVLNSHLTSPQRSEIEVRFSTNTTAHSLLYDMPDGLKELEEELANFSRKVSEIIERNLEKTQWYLKSDLG